jgi:hypothetical protein
MVGRKRKIQRTFRVTGTGPTQCRNVLRPDHEITSGAEGADNRTAAITHTSGRSSEMPPEVPYFPKTAGGIFSKFQMLFMGRVKMHNRVKSVM